MPSSPVADRYRPIDIRQPQQVVRATRPRPAAARRMPPMLHVAFDELPRRHVEQMGAAQLRLGGEQRQHVLQLIAESERAAGLIRSAPRPEPAAQRLADQPPVDDEIERVVRRVDLDGAERFVPHAFLTFERRVSLGDLAVSLRELRARARDRVPCPSTNATRFVSPGAISTDTCSAPQGSSPAPCRPESCGRRSAAGPAMRAMAADELRAIARMRSRPFRRQPQADAVGELRVVAAAREDRAGRPVDLGDHEPALIFAR